MATTTAAWVSVLLVGLAARQENADAVRKHECRAWAIEGECATNPGFMLSECREACASEFRAAPDASHDCDTWADEGECAKNPSFMNVHCAAACSHQWLWVPEVRRAVGLPSVPPPGASAREPAPAATREADGSLVLDGAAAIDARLVALSELVLEGVTPSGMANVPEDTGSLLAGVVPSLVLYPARLCAKLAADAGAADAKEACDEVAALGEAALAPDPARTDWALRELPHWARRLAEALVEISDVVEATGGRAALVRVAAPEGAVDRRVAASKRLAASAADLPVLGVGTCWLSEAETEVAVAAALAFLDSHPDATVHVDSAEAYRNEAAIGRALRAAAPRAAARVFLASKISDAGSLGYDGAKARVAATLANFGVDAVGLYSLHSAFEFRAGGAKRRAVVGAWRALAELQDDGVIAALGVSNFNAADLRAFADDPDLGGRRMPDVLQNKFDPYRRGDQQPASARPEDDVLAACADLGLALVAYSALSGWPFGFGALSDPLLDQIATARGVDVPALVTRWVLDSGHAAIPRSSSPAHVAANLGVLAAVPEPLSAAELAAIDGLAHLVAFDRNVATTPDALGVASGAAGREEL